MPHSSAVCSCTVCNRQLAVSFPNSNAPMVTFVLPASSASSTHTSRENDFVRAVVLANDQEAGVAQSRRGALQQGIALAHGDTFAAGVTGAAGKQIENGRRSLVDQNLDIAIHRRQKGYEKLFPRLLLSGFDAEGGGLFSQSGGKDLMIYVYPYSGDGGGVHQLRQDAGRLFGADHDVVRPAEVAGYSCCDGDGFGRG